jgi:hypothetical protein
MSLADELMAIDVAVAATDAVWRKRARELIVLALMGEYQAEHMWPHDRVEAEIIADRLLASVDKPGESGGANPLP